MDVRIVAARAQRLVTARTLAIGLVIGAVAALMVLNSGLFMFGQ
jgi:hypothetical protein